MTGSSGSYTDVRQEQPIYWIDDDIIAVNEDAKINQLINASYKH